MKLTNLPLALLVMIATLFALTAAGFGLSFVWDVDIMLASGETPDGFTYFLARTIAGVTLLGYVFGIGKLYDLFKYLLTFKGEE